MASDQGVADLTAMIKEFGFCFVKDTPHDDPDVTRQLLERIAFIRVTHYGGFYDFTPDLAMADTAYTNLALPAHTDTTYFTDPAGLQAFHLLEHKAAPPPSEEKEATSSVAGEAAAEGGKSLLVDGFNAARILKEEDPRAYEILSSVRLPWHASGNRVRLPAPTSTNSTGQTGISVLRICIWGPRITCSYATEDTRGGDTNCIETLPTTYETIVSKYVQFVHVENAAW